MPDISSRIESLRSYFASDSGNAELACELVDALLSIEAHAEAESLMLSFSGALQQASGVVFRRARVALMSGRYLEAIEQLQALLAADVEGVAIWHDLAFCQMCMHNTSAALQTLDRARARFGDTFELSIVSARISLMTGDFACAHKFLDIAASLESNHAVVMGLRALVLLDSGQIEVAITSAENCLRVSPDQHEALLVIGTAALWRQDVENADISLQRALMGRPNSGRARSAYGQLLMLRGDLAGSCDQLGQAVIAMPDHIGTWHVLAWSQLLLGNIEAAEVSYQHGLDLDHNFADSHGGLALVQVFKGQSDEASHTIKRALRLNAQCATALFAKSILLADTGQQEESDLLLAEIANQAGLPTDIDMHEFPRNLRARLASAALAG